MDLQFEKDDDEEFYSLTSPLPALLIFSKDIANLTEVEVDNDWLGNIVDETYFEP